MLYNISMSKKMYRVTVDTKTFIRFGLVILGFVVVTGLISQAAGGLLIIGAALFLALAISPLVKKLAKFIPGEGIKIPIAIAYVLVVGFISAFMIIVIPTVVNESIKFANNLPNTIDTISENTTWINDIGNNFGIENLQGQILDNVRSFGSSLVNDLGNNFTNSIGAVGGFLAAVILILVLALFMLTEGPTIMNNFWGNFKNEQSSRIHHTISRMGEVVSKYVSNALFVALINACSTAVVTFIVCILFHLDPGLALPFGLITGTFSLIPMFGSFIGGILVAILLAFNAWGAGLAFAVYTIIYLQIEANVISPKVQGRGLQLPALAILAAVTIGVYTFGIIGAIVSIPIAGCIKVIIEEYGKSLSPVEDKKEEVKEVKIDDKKIAAETK